MKVITNKACRDANTIINLELRFIDVENDNFKAVQSYYRKIKDFDVIVCHFVGENSKPLNDGKDTFDLTFQCRNVPINLSNAYVVWWNDDQPYNQDEMEAIIIKIIIDNIINSIFREDNKAERLSVFAEEKVLIPRQGGNGGVVSIFSC